MKILPFVLLVSLIFVGVSCDSPTTERGDDDLYQTARFLNLVDMHCRSVDYKNRRFALADSIRDLQGPMSGKKAAALEEGTARRLDSLKKTLAAESRLLADSIRIALRNLTEGMDAEDKRIFNDSLDAYVIRGGCREMPR